VAELLGVTQQAVALWFSSNISADKGTKPDARVKLTGSLMGNGIMVTDFINRLLELPGSRGTLFEDMLRWLGVLNCVYVDTI